MTVLAPSALRSPSRLVPIGVVAALLVAVAPAHADEPLAPEADTSPSRLPPPSTHVNLVLVGAAVTAGWYAGSVGMSYLWPDSDGASALRVPVAGPYLSLAKTGCAADEPSCGPALLVFRTVLTSLAAVGQTGGVLAMLEGVLVPTGAPRGAVAEGSARSSPRRPAAQVAVAPTAVGAGGVGLGIYGNF